MAENLVKLLEEKNYEKLMLLLEDTNAVDVAAILDGVENPEVILRLFRLLPKDEAADVFSYLAAETQEALINLLNDKELGHIIDEMYLDDAADLAGEMPANLVRRLLRVAHPDTRAQINRLLNYPEDSTGSIMTTEFIDLHRAMTIQQAFDYIRKNGVDKETIYTCYVTNETRILQGVVTVREMLLADPAEKVGEIMEDHVIYASTLDDQEQTAQLFQKYDMITLPVVDQEKRLVGIVTIDDAVDVIQQENTEDFELMAAVSPIEDSYMHTSVLTHARKRIVWLMFLMISSIVTGSIITHYEEAFAAIPLLVSFIPMLMDTSGNCGSQASTLIIRGMALGEITVKDFFRVLWKEIRVALVVGSTLAVIETAYIYLRYHNLLVALTVSISLLVTVCLAKSIACILPMVAKKLKQDPALMASPLLTTVVDACAMMVYFTVAGLLLHV